MADTVQRIIFDDSQAIASLKNLNQALEQTESNVLDVGKAQDEAFSGSTKDIDEATKSVQAYEESVAETAKTTTDTGGAVKELTGDVKIFGVNLTAVTANLKAKAVALTTLGRGLTATSGGFARATIAARAFGAALAATGIGALVVALGSLVTFFTKTQRGADQLSRVFKGLGAAVDVIVDRASAFGETIVEAFENPQQAIRDLGELVLNNIINRFTGIIDAGRAVANVVGSLLKGQFDEAKEAAADFGQSLIQVGTGLDPEQQEAIADGVKSITEEIKEEAAAAAELERQAQRLRDAQIEWLKTEAALNQEIAENRLVLNDVNEALDDRIAAGRRVLEAEEERARQQAALVAEDLRITKERNALGESTVEDIRREAELTAELINIETQRANNQRRILVFVNNLEKQRLALLEKLAEFEAKAAEVLDQFFADAARYDQAIDDIRQVGQAAAGAFVEAFVTEAGDGLEEEFPELASGIGDLFTGFFQDLVDGNFPGLQGLRDGVRGLLENLGLNEDQIGEFLGRALEAIGPAVGFITEQLNRAQELELQLIDERIARYDEQLDTLSNQIDEEQALRDEGLANRVNTLQNEIDQTTELRAEQEERRRQIEQDRVRSQQRAASLESATSLIVASANLYRALSPLGIAGIIIAGGLIATMFGAFVKAQTQAKELTRFWRGGRIGRNGNWRSDRNGQRGHRVEDSNVVLGGDEWVINGRTSGIHDRFLDRLNAGHYDNVDLVALANRGFDRRTGVIDRRAHRSELAAMQAAYGAGVDRLIQYFKRQGVYYTEVPGSTVVHVQANRTVKRKVK